jgi:hypothetical protein
MFVRCILCILGDHPYNVYMHIIDLKELCDALNAKFVATDAYSKLYIMSNFNDFRMVSNQFVVK